MIESLNCSPNPFVEKAYYCVLLGAIHSAVALNYFNAEQKVSYSKM